MVSLATRRIINLNDQECSTCGGMMKARDNHLFVKCDFYYGRLWYLVASWLDFSTTTQGDLFGHFAQFGGLGVIRKMFGRLITFYGSRWFGLYGRREIDVLSNIRRITYNL